MFNAYLGMEKVALSWPLTRRLQYADSSTSRRPQYADKIEVFYALPDGIIFISYLASLSRSNFSPLYTYCPGPGPGE